MRKALLAAAFALWVAPATPASAATRILYTGNWTGQPEVFAVDPSGKAPVAQLTRWHGDCSPLPGDSLDLAPSPDGRYVLARCAGALWLMRADGRAARELVSGGDLFGRPVWSRDSRRFAYGLANSVHVVDVATGRDYGPTPAQARRLGWTFPDLLSPDRRWIVKVPPTCPACQSGGLELVRLKDGAVVRVFSAVGAAWSPNGRWLALESHDAVRVYNMRTRRLRTLTTDVGGSDPSSEYDHRWPFGIAWAPDSRSIAYATGEERYHGDLSIASGDVKAVTLAGKTRSVIAADHAYGGQMTAVAWTNVPKGVRYETPDAEPLDRISPEGVFADGRIGLLAADGARVAFEACGRFFVWTPATSSLEPSFHPGELRCDIAERSFYYDLALAGDRVAYARTEGCNSITISLHVAVPPSAANQIESSYGSCGGPFHPALGRFAGAGDLLVYGEWWEAPIAYPYPVTQTSIRRVDGALCPCSELFSSPGPLYPADVNQDRVVAYGENETVVLDRDGHRLLSLAISPVAAQLAGSDLLLLTQGRLLDYDARNSALLHTWPLPDVPSGPVHAWRTWNPVRLMLTDAANGLVSYIVDGQLHVLRLADGADSVVAQASLARFMDLGLVYADGARIHLVPYAELP